MAVENHWDWDSVWVRNPGTGCMESFWGHVQLEYKKNFCLRECVLERVYEKKSVCGGGKLGSCVA